MTASVRCWEISPARSLSGAIRPASDKSITHRAIILASIAEGTSRISQPLLAGDTLGTLEMFKVMGISAKQEQDGSLIIQGKGFKGLQAPPQALDAGNSGTTMRLMAGLLSAQAFDTTMVGDASLSKRPMNRVIEPLRQMGAKVSAEKDLYPPLKITGGQHLKGIAWRSPVASAQVKSCLLLAGLYAQGETSVTEPVLSRDHSERMLQHFGAEIARQGLTVKIKKSSQPLRGSSLEVPGDISSTAFFLVAGLLVPQAQVTLRAVGVNPTRTGILKVLERMGGRILLQRRPDDSAEPVADISVSSSRLKATAIGREEIPSLVDEIPILAVAATQAEGQTVISGAEELRVKETDRLKALAQELSKMGANIQEKKDGLVITGPTRLRGSSVESFGDHRMAMSLAIAALVAEGKTVINDVDCVATSYPQFWESLQSLLR